MIEAYPLYWPDGWKTTPYNGRKVSKFKKSFAIARDFLLAEVKRLGGRSVILSTNVKLRQDGLPLANQRQPDNPGVAVYFEYKKQKMCFACDQYTKVEANMQAVGMTIDALRSIERWGASDMMERAFRGFTALEAGKSWRSVLGWDATWPVTADNVRGAFTRLAKLRHPDVGGSHEAFTELVNARDAALKELQ